MEKKHTTPPASDYLRQILRRLNPNVPAGQGEFAPPRIERPSNALRQLRAHINADPLVKVLLTGGALKNQVQHFWEKMLHGKHLHAVES